MTVDKSSEYWYFLPSTTEPHQSNTCEGQPGSVHCMQPTNNSSKAIKTIGVARFALLRRRIKIGRSLKALTVINDRTTTVRCTHGLQVSNRCKGSSYCSIVFRSTMKSLPLAVLAMIAISGVIAWHTLLSGLSSETFACFTTGSEPLSCRSLRVPCTWKD